MVQDIPRFRDYQGNFEEFVGASKVIRINEYKKTPSGVARGIISGLCWASRMYVRDSFQIQHIAERSDNFQGAVVGAIIAYNHVEPGK